MHHCQIAFVSKTPSYKKKTGKRVNFRKICLVG